ncbi:NAD(P)-binding protein [Durotheca rogersii]|uniref:NAD(P)-binding protein n=1 Tax=Durotheca rogersii TaxID=419775 RepID=UPI00221FB5DD|nr:NAD(P)-binding protein [Durotheca rogersii]KAI5863037.1 NAD(P)-binding protein [Durotheca rogersii]
MVKVLVLGATGKQGGATARALLSLGHGVRAWVRDASAAAAVALAAQGAELFVGGGWEAAGAPAELARAAAGVDGVFFVSAPSFTDLGAERRGAAHVVAAARASPSVRHFVYSSVGGVDRYEELAGWDASAFSTAYWVSKAETEALVRGAGFDYYTILRPAEFMSNYTDAASARFQVAGLLATGTLRTPMPADFVAGLVDPADIGRAAAAAFADPARLGRALETPLVAELRTVARILADLGAAAGGKTFRVSTYAPDEARARAPGDPFVAGQLARLNAGRLVDGDDAIVAQVRERFGLTFRSFPEHLAAHRDEVVELYKDAP